MSIVSSEITRLPGIKNAWRNYCVHPDGLVAFFYDNARNSFVEVDLTNGQHILVETKLSEAVGATKTFDLIAVTRSSKLFILALVYRKETGKMFVASFFFDKEKSTLCIADVKDTGTRYSSLYFQKDENDQIFALFYYLYRKSTGIYVSHIDVDDNGKITLNILIWQQRAMMGTWCAPFIHSRSLYFLPHGSAKKTKMLQVSLDDQSSAEFDIEIDPEAVFFVTQWSNNFWVTPQVVNDNIFYYAKFTFPMWQTDFFLHLDWKNKTWRKFSIDTDHKFMGGYKHPKLTLDVNGFLYLHGNCSHESCEENAHIFVIKPASYQALTLSNLNSALQNLHIVKRKNSIGQQERQKEEQDEEHKPADNTVTETETSMSYVSSKFDADQQMSHIVGQKQQYKGRTINRARKKWAPDAHENASVLGEGNFGIVYKCWDPERRREFVAKKAKLKTSQKSFFNEVNRLKDLSHPRIIEYYGFKLEDDGVVILMEYMPLGSVGAIIKKHGPVAEKTAMIYIEQILDGLAYLHDKGVVHNDLKCDNLLSDHNGNIKISDFGLAVQKHLNAENGSYMNTKSEILGGGTVFWTAPEFFETEVISRRSDVWSLGCTIVEMLTTKPPYFDLKNRMTLIIARAKNLLSYNPKELVPSATVPMQNFIGCLLQIDTEHRPANATEAAKKFCTSFS